MDIWMILLIVAAGVAALFLLGIGITFVVGMFFVRLAVGRKKAWDNSLIPRAEREQPKKYPQRQKIIDQNEARIRAENRQLLAKAREEDWQVNAEDGVSLVAKAYRQDGHRWVILVHGYMCTGRDMMDYSGMYLKEGVSLLVPDQRAHGRSGGKYTGMGWLERRDMVCWIREILQQEPQAEIVLHGVSMGAATVMMTAGEALRLRFGGADFPGRAENHLPPARLPAAAPGQLGSQAGGGIRFPGSIQRGAAEKDQAAGAVHPRQHGRLCATLHAGLVFRSGGRGEGVPAGGGRQPHSGLCTAAGGVPGEGAGVCGEVSQ